MAFLKQLKHAWNLFRRLDDPETRTNSSGISSSVRQDRTRPRFSNNERTIISSIYTRIAIDVAAVDIRHVRVDEDDRYLSDINSGLNSCLKLEANLDQAARHFRQDIISTLLDRGHAVIAPIDTTINPDLSGGYEILTMRVGYVVSWEPETVRVSVYNQLTGHREIVPVPKRSVAIIENPFYDVMNEPNSTLQRLTRKLAILDAIDEQSGSGKLDIIIQLPYAVRSESARTRATQRKADLEAQLSGSKYGIAYIDGTEKVTQLNRAAENNLLKQVEYLTNMLYGQLGLTPEIMNGTADKQAMLNYRYRTVEPFVTAIIEAMRRSFLTKTARSQGQSIMGFTDVMKFIPLDELAEIADKFTRNEIASANDIRQAIGWKPSKDPKADELRNSNMPDPKAAAPSEPNQSKPTELGGNSQNGSES